jgi:hypothetical protein
VTELAAGNGSSAGIALVILDMSRLTHVCATCEEHFTRKTSAIRHNLTIHNNRGEIVSLLEYIVGRTSGRYRASHPFWYRRRRKEKPIHTFARGATIECLFQQYIIAILIYKGTYFGWYRAIDHDTYRYRVLKVRPRLQFSFPP